MSYFRLSRHLCQHRHLSPHSAVAFLCLFCIVLPAHGDTANANQQDETEFIQLNFPENMEVKLLVDYVSKRLGMNILYDDAIGRKRVTIASPTKIPKDSLLGLLRSVLKMSDLALVEADQPGWLRIVQARELLDLTDEIRRRPEEMLEIDQTVPVTQVFELQHVGTSAAERVIKPFLTSPGGNMFSISDQNILIITDYGGNVRRIRSMLELVDQPGPEITVQFVEARHVQTSQLASDVRELLQEKSRLGADGARARAQQVTLRPDARTNRIAVIGPEDLSQEALEMLRSLDVPVPSQTVTYRLSHVSPRRIDRLAKELTEAESAAARYTSTIDEEAGLLIVSGEPSVHEQVRSLKEQLDVARAEADSNVRFYKLMNSTATDVLSTIQSIRSGEGFESLHAAVSESQKRGEEPFTGPNVFPGEPGRQPPEPPSYAAEDQQETDPENQARPETQRTDDSGRDGRVTRSTGDATITADVNTNTLIVVAPPAVQSTYERLISMLDKRRPQVLVEITLVTLDITDSSSVGVEVSGTGRFGEDDRYLVFSSFGLGEIDAETGMKQLIPGMGFNGVLVSPGEASIILRALESEGHSRVISRPKVLVNDNATATLSSVAEAPFTSINASQTVSTTSFAGYATAGTNIAVTPHISEGDHLQLQYSLTLNSFTGDGGSGIPPPRQTNSIDSEVTVPDGYTVIIGGLSREDVSDSESHIPWLGRLPVLEYLLGSQSKSASENTLFAFIRPVILRDDQFEDLKYLSERELELAELPQDLPTSEPMIMR